MKKYKLYVKLSEHNRMFLVSSNSLIEIKKLKKLSSKYYPDCDLIIVD